jgi:hypothetical protein
MIACSMANARENGLNNIHTIITGWEDDWDTAWYRRT